LHPDEKEWTRNLIVASPFGLKLHDDLQKNTPPFRDNYQTAKYLSTKLAVLCWQGKKEECQEKILHNERLTVNNEPLKVEKLIEKIQSSPRLFEIGNHSTVDLSHTQGGKLHPMPENLLGEKESKSIQTALFFILFTFFVLVFFIYLIPEGLRRITYVVCSGFILLAFGYIVLQLIDAPAAETFSFTNGTSTWPANSIKFLAIVLAFYLLINLKNQLKKSEKEINCEYKVEENHKNTPIARRDQLIIDRWHEELLAKTDGEISTRNKTKQFFSDLWSQYLQRATFCCMRVITLFVFFILCIGILILTGLFDWPNIPYRGQTSFYFSWGIILLIYTLYLTLIFIIADRAHLSSHFVKLLTTFDVIWPEHMQITYRFKHDLPDDVIKKRILLDFIYQHSSTINNFIYYPFIILLLLILSRSQYFDNWQYTPLLFIMFSFTAVIAMGSTWRLRQATKHAKKRILEQLNNDYWQSLSIRVGFQKKEKSDRIKLLINEIENLRDGPFLPLTKHPITPSLLMPFGGVGGLYLIGYLASII